MLTELNKHERITKHPNNHSYLIDGDYKDVVSSTTLIKSFFTPFDQHKIITKILASDAYLDPGYKYHGMSYEQIQSLWETNSLEARTSGTSLHEDIEDYYNGNEVVNDSVEYLYFQKFVSDHPTLKIYRSEWMIFIKNIRIAGTIDAVFTDGDDDELIIADWKRSREVTKKSFGDFARFPLSHLPDSNYYHYALQLNLYRVILEMCYNKKVKEMFLVVLHPGNDSYEKINIERMDKEINYIFWDRKKKLTELGYIVQLEIKHIPKRDDDFEFIGDSDKTDDTDVEEKIKPLLTRPRPGRDGGYQTRSKTRGISAETSPQKSVKTEAPEPKRQTIKIEDLSYIHLSKKQKEAYDHLDNGHNVLLTGMAGSGKCLVIGTLVLMFDGTLKKVEDVRAGDEIMGDDSTKRVVLSTTHGTDRMYEVSHLNGNEKYTVNSEHVLCLRYKKHKHIEEDLERGCISLVWFNSKTVSIEKQDMFFTSETHDYVLSIAREHLVTIDETLDVTIRIDEYLGLSEEIRSNLHGYTTAVNFQKNLVKDDHDLYTEGCTFDIGIATASSKFIPHKYKVSSNFSRMRFLAGLIHANAIIEDDGMATLFIRKTDTKLLEDVMFVCKSIGFRCSHKYYKMWPDSSVTNAEVYAVTIDLGNGDVWRIFSELKVVDKGYGTYHGFSLDGNHKFVLGNLVVTHNSGIIHLFRKNNPRKIIGVTSTTGTSAVLIGGTTVYSYLGIGIGTMDVEFLYMKIKSNAFISRRWKQLDVLIIDEISMMPPVLFDKLEKLARIIRGSNKPFGGIQLILSGDFLQLPCVNSKKFCFEAESWSKCIDEVINMTEVFRQTDKAFQKCLSEVRLGKLSKESIDMLKSREDVVDENPHGIRPTKIYALNVNVDMENAREMEALVKKNPDLEMYEYEMEFEILKKGYENFTDRMKKNCCASSVLNLCVGAQVMLLVNLDLDSELANGTRGVITSFVDDIPKVRFLNGVERLIDYHTWEIMEDNKHVLNIVQIPLKIAYAVTCHKMQGQTVDYCEIDMTGIFEDGMGYVALSRVKNLEGLTIRNLAITNIFANKTALNFYNSI